MDADLASYLDETVSSLQDGADRLVDCDSMKKKTCTFLKESRALTADLMADQPFFLLSAAFASGLLLGRAVFLAKKPS